MKGSCAKLIPQNSAGLRRASPIVGGRTTIALVLPKNQGKNWLYYALLIGGVLLIPLEGMDLTSSNELHPMVLGVHLCMNCLRQEVLQQKTMSNLSFSLT